MNLTKIFQVLLCCWPVLIVIVISEQVGAFYINQRRCNKHFYQVCWLVNEPKTKNILYIWLIGLLSKKRIEISSYVLLLDTTYTLMYLYCMLRFGVTWYIRYAITAMINIGIIVLATKNNLVSFAFSCWKMSQIWRQWRFVQRFVVSYFSLLNDCILFCYTNCSNERKNNPCRLITFSYTLESIIYAEWFTIEWKVSTHYISIPQKFGHLIPRFTTFRLRLQMDKFYRMVTETVWDFSSSQRIINITIELWVSLKTVHIHCVSHTCKLIYNAYGATIIFNQF